MVYLFAVTLRDVSGSALADCVQTARLRHFEKTESVWFQIEEIEEEEVDGRKLRGVRS